MCVIFWINVCYISSIVRVAIDFLSIGLSEFLTYMIDPPPLLDGVGLSTEKWTSHCESGVACPLLCGESGGDGEGGGGGGGIDFGGEECFYGLFMRLPLEVGGLPHFPTMWVGTVWSRNAPMLLY